MTDRPEADQPDQRDPDRAADVDATRASEGVRILGAEEAQAALETGQVTRRLGEDAPRFGDVPPRPDPSVRPAARFPRATATGDEEGEEREDTAVDDEPSGEIVIDVSEEDEASGPVPLPHWTEPPTGEIPVILPEAEVVDDEKADDLDAWQAAGGGAPRFRSGAGDWAGADFAEGLKDDETALGALAADADDDAEFEDRVAQRRRRRLRVRGDGADTDRPPVPPAGARTGAPSRAGEPEPVPAAAEPTLVTRVIVGVAVGVGALVVLKLGRGPTAVLAAVIVGLATFELYEALRKRGFHPATVLGLLAAVTTPLAAYKVGESAFPLMLALVTVFSLLWYLFEVVKARAVVNVGITLLVYAYVGALGGFAGLLLGYPDGVGLILGVAICAVGYDVFGYVIGSQFGKTNLAPSVSPNKTLEGLLGGMTASILLSALVVNRITPWTDLGHALSLGVVVAIAAPLGDLCESLLKRDLGLKDFGSILPGHGGILDRFDAILFCLPAVYYLARYLKIG